MGFLLPQPAVDYSQSYYTSGGYVRGWKVMKFKKWARARSYMPHVIIWTLFHRPWKTVSGF